MGQLFRKSLFDYCVDFLSADRENIGIENLPGHDSIRLRRQGGGSLSGPDGGELALAAVATAATSLPSCCFYIWCTIVNILPNAGKMATLDALTRGSIGSVWIPLALLVSTLVARKLGGRRAYVLVTVFAIAAFAISIRRIDMAQMGAYAVVAACSALAAVKAV